jgi:hypothetical protein
MKLIKELLEARGRSAAQEYEFDIINFDTEGPLGADDVHANAPQELRKKMDRIQDDYWLKHSLSEEDAKKIEAALNAWETRDENQAMTAHVYYEYWPGSKLPHVSGSVACYGVEPSYGVRGGWVSAITKIITDTIDETEKDPEIFEITVRRV